MAQFTIKADDRAVQRRFKVMGKYLKDFKKPLKESADFAKEMYEANFDKKGSEFGGWKPLAPSTLMAKTKAGYPSKPLIRTGKMKGSFDTKELKKTKAVVWNKLQEKYFKYHQLGTSKMPKRVMISINKKLEDKVQKFFKDYIHKSLKK